MSWFRKAKPERRFLCRNCNKIMTKADGIKYSDGRWFHKLWKSNLIQGVDFGDWEWHTNILCEAEDAPSTPTPDGRLSVVDSGTLSLTEPYDPSMRWGK